VGAGVATCDAWGGILVFGVGFDWDPVDCPIPWMTPQKTAATTISRRKSPR